MPSSFLSETAEVQDTKPTRRDQTARRGGTGACQGSASMSSGHLGVLPNTPASLLFLPALGRTLGRLIFHRRIRDGQKQQAVPAVPLDTPTAPWGRRGQRGQTDAGDRQDRRSWEIHALELHCHNCRATSEPDLD